MSAEAKVLLALAAFAAVLAGAAAALLAAPPPPPPPGPRPDPAAYEIGPLIDEAERITREAAG